MPEEKTEKTPVPAPALAQPEVLTVASAFKHLKRAVAGFESSGEDHATLNRALLLIAGTVNEANKTKSRLEAQVNALAALVTAHEKDKKAAALVATAKSPRRAKAKSPAKKVAKKSPAKKKGVSKPSSKSKTASKSKSPAKE